MKNEKTNHNYSHFNFMSARDPKIIKHLNSRTCIKLTALIIYTWEPEGCSEKPGHVERARRAPTSGPRLSRWSPAWMKGLDSGSVHFWRCLSTLWCSSRDLLTRLFSIPGALRLGIWWGLWTAMRTPDPLQPPLALPVATSAHAPFPFANLCYVSDAAGLTSFVSRTGMFPAALLVPLLGFSFITARFKLPPLFLSS